MDHEDGVGSAAGLVNMGGCGDSMYTGKKIRTGLLIHGGSLRIHGEYKSVSTEAYRLESQNIHI